MVQMNPDPDMPPLSLSIWPYDTWNAPDSVPTREFRRLRCFVLCPFDRAGTILPILRAAAQVVERTLNHEVQVYFAGDIVGSSAIHPDIWTHIHQADMIVADITGYNPNVMYELGVAAAWRPLPTVIIVRDRSDQTAFAFDLQPARQIVYDSTSIDWMSFLTDQFIQSLLICLAMVPFSHEPQIAVPSNFEVNLADGRDTQYLWSPGPGHRRLVSGGLEFGSPFYFPYSWLSVPGLRPANIEVWAEMRFSIRNEPCWLGLGLRSQGYLAGSGTEYLAWLSHDGNANRTGPAVDGQGKDEHNLGQLTNYDPNSDVFIPFRVSMNTHQWQISIGDVNAVIPVADLPHVFPNGRIMFQAYSCRGVIRNVRVQVSSPDA